jgi:hypothetical protein
MGRNRDTLEEAIGCTPLKLGVRIIAPSFRKDIILASASRIITKFDRTPDWAVAPRRESQSLPMASLLRHALDTMADTVAKS